MKNKPIILTEIYALGEASIRVYFPKGGTLYTYTLNGDDVGRFKEKKKGRLRWLMKHYNKKGKKR